MSLNTSSLKFFALPALIGSSPTRGSAESSIAFGAMNSIQPSMPRSSSRFAESAFYIHQDSCVAISCKQNCGERTSKDTNVQRTWNLLTPDCDYCSLPNLPNGQ